MENPPRQHFPKFWVYLGYASTSHFWLLRCQNPLGGNTSDLERWAANGRILHDARRSDASVFFAGLLGLPLCLVWMLFAAGFLIAKKFPASRLRIGASDPTPSSFRAASCSLLHLGGSRRALVRSGRLRTFLYKGGRGQREHPPASPTCWSTVRK